MSPSASIPVPSINADRRRWIVLAVLVTAPLMIVLDSSIVNIALPHAQASLGISNANRQWIVTAYSLAFGGLLLLGGRIADFGGRKRAFVIGLVGFAIASAAGGAAQSGAVLFAARAVQGGFAALLAPAALSLISVRFVDPLERAKAFGVYGAVTGAGVAAGLVFGGALTEVSWRLCLYVNVPLALLTLAAAIPLLTESRAHGDTRYDLPGAVLVGAGLAAITAIEVGELKAE
jgi:MFS family permease